MKKYLSLIAISALFSFGALANAQNYSFSNDLTLGSSGSDVVNLQSWLMSNGYDIPAVSSGVTTKGYFGAQTKAALAKYQAWIGLPSFGFFGSLTRARISGATQNAFTVTSPNGGETWVKGTVQNITWNIPASLSLINDQKVDITLQYQLPACAEPGQIVRCMVLVRAPLLIAKGVSLNSRSYAWNVGAATDLGGSNPTIAADGKYKIQVCSTDGSSCDTSDAYFNLVSAANADAPTTLAVGQTGTWTVHATDPQSGQLGYSVNWGDVAPCPVGFSCVPVSSASPSSFVQSTSFSHAYATVGTYTVSFSVQNASGVTSQTSASVQVTGSSVAGPLKIVSPNGGETWYEGATQIITWTSPYYFRATTADLNLLRKYVCTTQVCPMIAYAPITIATGIPINQNSYSWYVGNAGYATTQNSCTPGSCPSPDISIPAGQYQIQICESGTTNCDASDGVFTISAPTPTASCPLGSACARTPSI